MYGNTIPPPPPVLQESRCTKGCGKEDFRPPVDKPSVSRLAQLAQELLDAALAATNRGEVCTEMTILIGPDGAIRMSAASDWPLDSLARDHGARAAFRIREQDGRVSVCGREGSHTCFLESRSQHAIAGLLFARPSLR